MPPPPPHTHMGTLPKFQEDDKKMQNNSKESPVVWSRRIKHFCASSQSKTKKNKTEIWGWGTYPQSQGYGAGVCAPPPPPPPPIFHSVDASIANLMESSSGKANNSCAPPPPPPPLLLRPDSEKLREPQCLGSCRAGPMFLD